MKPLRIGLMILIGLLVILGVYWRSQAISDSANDAKENTSQKDELDADLKPLVARAKKLAKNDKRDRAARILLDKARALPTGHQADQLRFRAVQFLVMDYVKSDGRVAPVKELATELREKSSPGMQEIAYIVAADMNIFVGQYERARKVLQNYLQEYPPLSEKEIQRYHEIRRASGSRSEEDPPEIPPRTQQRAMAKRKLEQLDLVGKPAPTFEVTTLDGDTISPADYRGQTLLMLFWAASSRPCRQRMPQIQSAYRSYHEDGLAIVGLSLDENADQLEKYISNHEIPWSQGRLVNSAKDKVTEPYKVKSIPAMFLIGPNGKIRAYGRSLIGNGLERTLQPILGEMRE